MPRLVRRSREALIREGFEAQLAERERVVQLLVEQVEYLRAQLGMPTSTVSMAVAPPESLFDLPPGVPLEQTNALTDEHEELLALKQAGVISDVEYQEALERVKRTGPDDIIE